VSWSREFVDPIVLPDGRTLQTPLDAGNNIDGLAPKEKKVRQWHDAVEALRLLRTAVHVRAHRLHASFEPSRRTVFDPSRRDKHWGKRKLVRDK